MILRCLALVAALSVVSTAALGTSAPNIVVFIMPGAPGVRFRPGSLRRSAFDSEPTRKELVSHRCSRELKRTVADGTVAFLGLTAELADLD